MIVGQLKSKHTLLRRQLGEHHPNAGLIGASVAVGRVVHLEHQVGACRNKLRHAIGPVVRRTTRGIDQEQVAGGGVRIVTKLVISQTRRSKGHSDGRTLQPFRIWRANVDDGVMHVALAGRMHFQHLHPFVFAKTCGHDLVGVGHITLGCNCDRLRHLHDCVGPRDVPALDPLRG